MINKICKKHDIELSLFYGIGKNGTIPRFFNFGEIDGTGPTVCVCVCVCVCVLPVVQQPQGLGQ